jgi:large subunit ribosomal protein L25
VNSITVEKRNPAAKAKQLRRSGIVPCVIYGSSLEESISGQMGRETARQLLRKKHEGSTVKIQYEGTTIPGLVKSVDRSVIGDEILHIGFQALDAKKSVNSKARIILENKEKVEGVLEQMLFEVQYAALPEDLFDTITIDLSSLSVGTVLTVEDIPALCEETIALQTATDNIVLRIGDKKRI